MSFLGVLIGLVVSASPFAELRAGIPVLAASGMSLTYAFLFGVVSNILIIPVIFLFLDFFHHRFMSVGIYRRTFNRKIEKSRGKINGRFSAWPFVGLWFLVAIPFPGTGVYTASLLAWFFKFNRKRSFLAMSLGVVFAGFLVSGICAGAISLFW